MDCSSLPHYPAFPAENGPPLDVRRERVIPRPNPRRFRLVRDLVFLAAIAVLLIQSRRLERSIERWNTSRDLYRVYDSIPSQYDFNHFRRWCRLEIAQATPEEADLVSNVVSAAADKSEYTCSPPDAIYHDEGGLPK